MSYKPFNLLTRLVQFRHQHNDKAVHVRYSMESYIHYIANSIQLLCSHHKQVTKSFHYKQIYRLHCFCEE
nr:MAG TPA: hypothetical protein [Caudoviricetes sp.]